MAAAWRASGRQDAGRKAEKHLRRECSRCHEYEVVRVQRLTRSEWNEELNKMEVMGADVRNRGPLLDYLARKYGPRKSGKQPVE